MKRTVSLFTILVVLTFATALPAWAQTENIITLNDASPAIDVVITLPQDTTGAVAVEFHGAALRVTDEAGSAILQAADARLHGLEFNIAPNSGTHTLTIERLPGVTEASARVTSLAELSQHGNTELVTGLSPQPRQEVALPLSSEHPGDTVSLNLLEPGIITASFPGAGATTQLVDAAGLVVVQSAGGHVDGLSLLIESGVYQFTMVGGGFTQDVIAGVSLISASDVGVVAMPAPTAAQETVVVSSDPCTASVAVSSSNLRSGPGTGYTVLGYGYRDQSFVVGGRNIENNWLLLALNSGESAWVSRSVIQTHGTCDTLTTFNIPLRDAQPAPLVFAAPVQAPAASAPAASAPVFTDSSDEHEDEHEDHEGEHEEHDDGDD